MSSWHQLPDTQEKRQGLCPAPVLVSVVLDEPEVPKSLSLLSDRFLQENNNAAHTRTAIPAKASVLILLNIFMPLFFLDSMNYCIAIKFIFRIKKVQKRLKKYKRKV